MPQRIRIHLKIVCTGISYGALLFALLLLTAACLLKPLGIVEAVTPSHIQAIYEIGFPLVAVFWFSQLAAEELEEGVLKWLFSLPLRGWRLLAEKWAIGLLLLLAVYYGSLAAIDLAVVDLDWRTVTLQTLVPSLWLGHLTLLAALIGRKDAVGIAAGLFYWATESLSRGMVTQKLYLFMATFPYGGAASDVVWNRSLLILMTIAACAASFAVFRYKRHFMK